MLEKEDVKETKPNLPYPYNLMEALSLGTKWTNGEGDTFYYILPDSINSMLNDNNLTDKEKKVIELRWKYLMTLKEVGNVLGLTTERIRQIEAKALRKLSSPKVRKENTYVSYNTYIAEKHMRERLESLVDSLTHVLETVGISTAEKIKDMSICIEDMDFTVRSYNCLKRYGIKTLSDITNIETEEEFHNIRNLGQVCRREVLDKVHIYGRKMKWE